MTSCSAFILSNFFSIFPEFRSAGTGQEIIYDIIKTIMDRPMCSRSDVNKCKLFLAFVSVCRIFFSRFPRVCIDPSQTINKAIEIPKYPISKVDELLPKLNNVKIFSCVDVYKEFTNIE